MTKHASKRKKKPVVVGSARTRVQKTIAICVVFVIAAIGAYLLVISRAASPYTAQEAESSSNTLGGAASVQGNANASGGKYVQFGQTGLDPAGVTLGAPFEATFAGDTTSQQNTIAANMKAAGVQWVRVDIYPTSPKYKYAELFAQAGFKVLAVLQGHSAASLNDPTTLDSFFSDATKTLKAAPYNVSDYEVWNEPNGCEDTAPAPQYTAVLKEAYKVIKTTGYTDTTGTKVAASDPGATILTAGLCTGSGANDPQTYLTAMYAAGAKGSFDAMNMHPYTYPNNPLQNTQNWNPWTYLPLLYNIMVKNTDGNKKIWLTEYGCPDAVTGSRTKLCLPEVNNVQQPLADQRAEMASEISDAFCLVNSTNTAGCTDSYCVANSGTNCTTADTSINYKSFVGPLFLFNWQDSSDGDFGLYSASGVAKAAPLAAFQKGAL